MKYTGPRPCSTFLFSAIIIFCVAFDAVGQKRAPSSPCACPLLQVNTHFTSVRAGDVVEFTVTRKDGKTDAVQYKWKVSGGKIISGKGTAIIRVRAAKDLFRNTVTAVVETESGAACKCPLVSETVKVGRRTINTNSPANVVSLVLDKTELTAACAPGTLPVSGKASVDMVIDVLVEAEDKENDVLVYEYTVTGGRIVGTGAKLKWDLTEATPGNYLITASVDDGCGFCGRVMTRTITVWGCAAK